jgi:hypothetical protein
VGTGGLNIYGEKRRIVDNILGVLEGNANYFWKNEIKNKCKAR